MLPFEMHICYTYYTKICTHIPYMFYILNEYIKQKKTKAVQRKYVTKIYEKAVLTH